MFDWRRHRILWIRGAIFALLAGIFAGLVVALFLFLLDRSASLREAYPNLLFSLPLIGVVIVYCYERWDDGSRHGSALILDRIHHLGERIPFRMIPFVMISTVLTHLGGGSAGREGAAVQMGASIADKIAKLGGLSPAERRRLLIAGAGAGFSAAFGTPMAGMVFGAEVVNIGKLEWGALGESLLASFFAYGTVHAIGVHHTLYPIAEIPRFTPILFLSLIVVGISFGIAAQFFLTSTHLLEKFWKSMIRNPLLRAVSAGILLVGAFLWEGSGRFQGLGFAEILRSFHMRQSFAVPLYKSLFTSLTLAGGFKGGEFVPLIFIGTSLGSALAPIFHLPISFLAALGLAACFGACANTPIAAILLLGEVFGWQLIPYAIIACYCAYGITGEQGIYRGQGIHRRKPLAIFIGKFRLRTNSFNRSDSRNNTKTPPSMD